MCGRVGQDAAQGSVGQRRGEDLVEVVVDACLLAVASNDDAGLVAVDRPVRVALELPNHLAREHLVGAGDLEAEDSLPSVFSLESPRGGRVFTHLRGERD
jgi:hypothetical protein